MRCPFRAYCFYLAEKLGKTVKEIMQEMGSKEISEWMAYDLVRNEDWQKKYKKERELERLREMDKEDRIQNFKNAFMSNSK